TPLSAYASFFDSIPEDDYRPLVDTGLGITGHISTVEHVCHGLEREGEHRSEKGHDLSFEYWKTPVGTLRQGWTDGWHSEHLIKSPADYKVMQWIVENAELLPSYDLVAGSRTPAMAINVELAGTERFCMDLATGVEELFDLYEAMKRQLLEETKIIAAGPGAIVKWMENLTVSMLGPQRYAELLAPVYAECTGVADRAARRGHDLRRVPRSLAGQGVLGQHQRGAVRPATRAARRGGGCQARAGRQARRCVRDLRRPSGELAGIDSRGARGTGAGWLGCGACAPAGRALGCQGQGYVRP
ncbi:MAG: hypothetical protein ACYS8L_11095, partial [Planctomycetota bacterium]